MASRFDAIDMPGGFEYISQVVPEWEEQPFVEIKVISVEQARSCSIYIGWEPVFKKKWAGIEKKCIETRSSGRRNGRSCSKSVKEKPPVIMENLGG